MYLFLAALGLLCCAWAFSSCGEGTTRPNTHLFEEGAKKVYRPLG